MISRNELIIAIASWPGQYQQCLCIYLDQTTPPSWQLGGLPSQEPHCLPSDNPPPPPYGSAVAGPARTRR